MKKEKRISGSVFAKIVAFFVLALSSIAGIAAFGSVLLMLNTNAYNYQAQDKCVQVVAREMMVKNAWLDMHVLRDQYYTENVKGLEERCQDKNYAVEFYEDEDLIWSNYEGEGTPYSFRYTYSQWVEEPVIEEVEVPEKPAKPEIPEVPENSEIPGTDSNEENVYIVPEGEGAVKLEEDNAEVEVVSGEVKSVDENSAKLVVEETSIVPEEADATEEAEPEMQRVLKEYTVRLYVNPNFPIDDEYCAIYNRAVLLCEGRFVYPIVVGVCVFLMLVSFIFLMCGAGHKNGKEGITPGILTAMHFDVVAIAFGMVAFFGCIILYELLAYGFDYDVLFQIGAAALLGGAEVIWCTIFCMDFATRLKLGGWWKHTLIATVFRFLGRILRFCKNAIVTLVQGLPLVITVVIAYLILGIGEFIGLCIWGGSTELAIVWFVEKLILLPIVMYFALICKRLQAGSKSLAEGDLNFKIDTSKMILDFKEHGENLNQIGEGISKAVAERMKSEHLKTELITNVSHDLKTPLTSIINYADLLSHEVQKTKVQNAGDLAENITGEVTDLVVHGKEAENNNDKLAEYAEVLYRQSKRLKKLLEDLVEASKATTGALEVNLEQCEIGVLLSQAVGEYEQRFAEKQLNLIVRQPQEPVRIMADGRHLWRVFDNLLNNICKYAQENTRVYLSVENKASQVEIIFRNMSKYALDISAEELAERFVRGDKSRHKEGNGLGLSIAKSLVELQNGRMEIVTDGDLFKVILYFQAI